MRRSVFAVLTTATVGALGAATTLVAQVPGSPNPAAVTGGAYTADSGHTLVEWELNHLGFSPYFGLFGEITGTLQLDPKNPAAAKVDMTIPVSKVVTASARLTQHLLKPADAGKSPDFFGPTPADAKFVSTKVTPSGQNATIEGNLTLNGVTKPVTLQAKFYGAGKGMNGKENIGFSATGTLKRSDFGIGFGVPAIGDEVKLKIAAAFQK